MERLWQVCIYLGFRLLNVGLFFGILLGGLMVSLRLAKPLLTSKQRVGVWMVGWIMLYLSLLFTTPSALLHVLPVTLPSLVTPRTMTEPGLSAYLPQYAGPGSYNLAFPGGGVVQIRLTDGICLAIAAVWLLGAAAMVLTMYRGSGRLRRLGMRGEHLEEGHPYYRDMTRTVGIWLCASGCAGKSPPAL